MNDTAQPPVSTATSAPIVVGAPVVDPAPASSATPIAYPAPVVAAPVAAVATGFVPAPSTQTVAQAQASTASAVSPTLVLGATPASWMPALGSVSAPTLGAPTPTPASVSTPHVAPQFQQDPTPQPTPALLQPPKPTADLTEPPDQETLSDSQKLAIFSDVIDTVNQADAQFNPPHPLPSRSGAKEVTEATTSPDAQVVDTGPTQQVELEKTPELPVEVEGFLKKVDDLSNQKPPEIFIADGTQESAAVSYPSRPVVVLPITEEAEKVGAHKNTTFSIRWLIEWSRKIMKLFAGKVIYRQVNTES